MMTNRMLVVSYDEVLERAGSQVETSRRILLFNPTDYERGMAAPFFRDLRARYGGVISDRLLARRHGTVESHLGALGIGPDDVDYLAFDHLHVQDVRGWLGGKEARAYFPRAKLLVFREEWEATRDLHPLQIPWYVADGTSGVPDDRVCFLEGATWLGKGLALIMTPGHTAGNMSLVFSTAAGVFVTSENGVATESYAPERSRIRGLARHARTMGVDVVMNGNTRENSLEQYTSMIVEKTLARRPEGEWPGFLPSSELTASMLAPGLAPTFSHGDVSFGTIEKRAGV
jgi:hypothetical protein